MCPARQVIKPSWYHYKRKRQVYLNITPFRVFLHSNVKENRITYWYIRAVCLHTFSLIYIITHTHIFKWYFLTVWHRLLLHPLTTGAGVRTRMIQWMGWSPGQAVLSCTTLCRTVWLSIRTGGSVRLRFRSLRSAWPPTRTLAKSSSWSKGRQLHNLPDVQTSETVAQ